MLSIKSAINQNVYSISSLDIDFNIQKQKGNYIVSYNTEINPIGSYGSMSIAKKSLSLIKYFYEFVNKNPNINLTIKMPSFDWDGSLENIDWEIGKGGAKK
jgi:hypothetical protein